ncbi:MAG: hypothetical protein QM778_04675 [Myxococcales bacterium]
MRNHPQRFPRLSRLFLLGLMACGDNAVDPQPSQECASCSPSEAGVQAPAPSPCDAGDACFPLDGGLQLPPPSCDSGSGCVPTDGGSIVLPTPGCDTAADPRDTPSCVTEQAGVFVDSTGNDANPGTRDAPLKTIGAALAKRNGRSRIYLCQGIYAESVELTSAVSLHGGFACGSWSHIGKLVYLLPPPGAYAIHVDGVQGVALSDLAFVAAAGTSQARSSVAAFVSRSSEVVFRRVLLQAQTAASGTPGSGGFPGTHDIYPGGNGSNSNEHGGDTRICTCSSGDITIGGAGGDATAGTTTGGNGGPVGGVAVPPNAVGGGQTAEQCAKGDSHQMAGSQGATGNHAPPLPVIGYVDAEHGFVPADGTAGGPGSVGQGGGGGGASAPNDPGGGGSGGCGGCGASGSFGGQGGGASIGLLMIEASIRLENSFVTTAKAGDGGQGGRSASGGAGGQGGTGFGGGCTGGSGGQGGASGAGGGGAGGISIGIAFRGSAPELDGFTRDNVKVGAAGAAGGGGAPGVNDGPSGIAIAVGPI